MITSANSDVQIQRADFGRVTVFFGKKSGKYPDGNQIIIHGSDTHAALDTPIVSNYIGPELDNAELVVMGHVHEDHMAGLHRLPNARVYAHSGDLPALQSWNGMLAASGVADTVRAELLLSSLKSDFFYAPRPDAVAYEDGASWDLGQSRISAVHMPGHTAGHCVLLIEPEGIAFIGDIDLSSFGPYYGDASSSLQAFRDSLARLPDIPAKVWVTSHHRGIYTDREKFMGDLAAFAAKIDDREQRLIAILKDQPMTLPQLADQGLLYPKGAGGAWSIDSEIRTIRQHLDELIADGRVQSDELGTYRLR